MDHQEAVAFAQQWVEAWNAHDLDAMLSHFSDDVVFTSPVASSIMPGSDGVLRGKEELRGYWKQGLARIPDLHFTVEAVYAGVATVVINYRNHVGALVCEVLEFDGPGDKVATRGHGTYLMTDAAGASGVQD